MRAPDKPPDDPGSRGERRLIAAIADMLRAAGEPAGLAVPFGDDMAGVPGESRMLWTTDLLTDGVDFESERHDWHTIGRKAMAVNLSDCAAMAVRPIGALCAVCLNNAVAMEDALNLHRGANELGARFGCPIVGGDTNSWESPTVIAITVLARAESGPPILRSGARPGDGIWVSGPLGGSILGRHLWFEPRIELAMTLRRRLGPHAMIDISDGLVLDLWRVASTSDCGVLLDEQLVHRAIHADAIELSASDGQRPIDHALYDGEDFELLVALPPTTPRLICDELGLLRLGEFTAERGVFQMRRDGVASPVEIRGWEHFR